LIVCSFVWACDSSTNGFNVCTNCWLNSTVGRLAGMVIVLFSKSLTIVWGFATSTSWTTIVIGESARPLFLNSPSTPSIRLANSSSSSASSVSISKWTFWLWNKLCSAIAASSCSLNDSVILPSPIIIFPLVTSNSTDASLESSYFNISIPTWSEASFLTSASFIGSINVAKDSSLNPAPMLILRLGLKNLMASTLSRSYRRFSSNTIFSSMAVTTSADCPLNVVLSNKLSLSL